MMTTAAAPAQILVLTEGDIAISETLAHEGRAPLAIYGRGQGVRSDANVTLLAVNEGADLTVDNLSFAGAGDLAARVVGITTAGNDDGASSIEVVQEDAGTGTLRITGATLAGDVEADGVDVMRE